MTMFTGVPISPSLLAVGQGTERRHRPAPTEKPMAEKSEDLDINNPHPV